VIARPALLLGAAALVCGGAFWTMRDDAAPTGSSSLPMDGAALFQAKGCAGCHATQLSGFTGPGPDLTDAADWAGTRIAGVSAEDYIRQSILDPQSYIAPADDTQWQMPSLPLAPEELDVLVTYLLGRA
jgi:cytochrome c551/c552